MSHPTEKEIIAILSSMKVCAQLSPEAIKALANCAVLSTYKSNQHIWKSGDAGEFCAIILSGLVEINRPSGTEEETCVGIFGKNDVIGLYALLKKTTYPGTSKILDDATAIKFYIRPLLTDPEPKKVNIEVSNWCREMMMMHEQILREKIDILTAGTIEDRLLELIKQLLRRFGQIKTGCKYEINIKLAKSKAAKLMGIRNETAIRLINDWQKKNLITWGSDKIVLHDLELIERYIMHQRSE